MSGSAGLFDLTGRRALVTGGTRGIGRAITLALADAGANVAFTHAGDDDGAGALGLTVTEPKREPIPIANGTPDAPSRIVAAATGALGGIDILVLNAWVDVREDLFSLTDDSLRTQVQANFLDNLLLATLCAQGMQQRRWGRILFIGSINQVTPLKALPVYAALKCAMSSIVRSLAIELAGANVTANALLPGLVETERNANRRAPGGDWEWHSTHSNYFRRAATPDEVAGFALFLCSASSSFCTGSEYFVDGGAHIPGKFNWQHLARRAP